jgi:hypothetical protein
MTSKHTAAARKSGLDFRKEAQARESAEAWKAYNAQTDAVRQRTAKLRAERLAREASARDGARAPLQRARAASSRRPS